MAIKFNKSAFLEQIAEEKVSEKKERKARESSFDHDKVDLAVFRAILRATSLSIKETLTEHNRSLRNGILIGDLLISLPRFSKIDPTNRAIVKESIDSLQARNLVTSSDFGKYQYLSATNGSHYYVADDGRIVTNFYSRNENPLKALFRQQEEREISRRFHEEMQAKEIETQEIETQEIQEVTDFSGMEEYVERELEFADDSFSDNDSDLNPDAPE